MPPKAKKIDTSSPIVDAGIGHCSLTGLVPAHVNQRRPSGTYHPG